MNAFLRNFVKIAFISIGVGIILIVIAYSMNKSIFDRIARNGFVLFGQNAIWTDWENDYNDDWTASNLEEKGIFSDTELKSPSKSDKIESIDINVIAGSVSIVEGEEFKLQVNDVETDRVRSEFDNGVWSIEDSLTNSSTEEGIRIFGINVNSNSLQNKIGNIKITIPKGFHAENVSLKCGAGSITVDNLSADEITISVGAGSCRIDKLTAKEKSDYTVGAGEIRISNMFANNANFNGSMGSIFVKGILIGKNSVVCSMGTIDLVLEGQEENYNYSGKCSMGTVTINDSNFTGINQNFDKDNGADNEIEVNCNVGTVNLKIND